MVGAMLTIRPSGRVMASSSAVVVRGRAILRRFDRFCAVSASIRVYFAWLFYVFIVDFLCDQTGLLSSARLSGVLSRPA